MPSFACRRVDPTMDEVRELVKEAYRRPVAEALSAGEAPPGGGDQFSPDELCLRAAMRAEGVYAREYSAGLRNASVVVGASWWTDPLGRKHWYIEGALVDGRSSRFSPAMSPWETEDGFLPRAHPLAWIAPELAFGWRIRDGHREPMVVCACGECGAPGELAWAAASCGPCSDREQEGLPPVGQPVLRTNIGRVSGCVLLEGGTLLTIGPDEATALDDDDGASLLRAWRAPWGGAPVWQRRLRWGQNVSIASNRQIAAVYGADHALRLLRVEDGADCDAPPPDGVADYWQVGFVGKGGARLIGVQGPVDGAYELWLRECGDPGAFGRLIEQHQGRFPNPFPVAVAPDRSRFIVPNRRSLEVRDAETGELRERLALPTRTASVRVAVAASGAVFATSASGVGEGEALHRWAPALEARRGWASWLGISGRRPDNTVALDSYVTAIAVSPDGAVIAVSRPTGLAFRDATELSKLAFFHPLARFLNGLAFTSDGQLLATTDRGLAVWPWRELAGLRV